MGYVRVDVSAGAAVRVSPLAPANADWCLLQADGGEARWRDDGVDPTATSGMRLLDGQLLPFHGNVEKLRIWGTGFVSISFYGG